MTRILSAFCLACVLCLCSRGRAAGGEALEDATLDPKKEVVPRFEVTDTNPFYFNSSIEFRDAEGKLWPAYFLARGATKDGYLVCDEKQPKGAFVLKSHEMALIGGAQDKRIMGELVRIEEKTGAGGEKTTEATAPILTLTLSSIGPLREEESQPPGKKKSKFYEVEVVLEIDKKKIPLKGTLRLNRNIALDKIENKMGLASVGIRMDFDVTGVELGLRVNADKKVRISAITEAFPKQATREDNAKTEQKIESLMGDPDTIFKP